ncbi:hypothetical protein ACFYUY_30890 [Kitasatospora sp. NPDC004745]|uniref:hypothetical protein n=1 Tax=unclassified Kitasatospora TaxID=2633591 RepID=UPI0033C5A6FF
MTGEKRTRPAVDPLADLAETAPDDLFAGRAHRARPAPPGDEDRYGGDDDLYGFSAAVAPTAEDGREGPAGDG